MVQQQQKQQQQPSPKKKKLDDCTGAAEPRPSPPPPSPPSPPSPSQPMHQPLEKKWDKSYAELEEETQAQSDVQLWHDIRFGRVTGTMVSDLLSAVRQGDTLHEKGLANKDTYVSNQWSKILHRKGGMLEKGGTVAKNKCPVNNLSCIIYGREMEGRAREQYRKHLKAFDPQSCIERMGFVAGKYAGCGCSPDGIATFQGRKYLLEIK